MTEPMFKIEPIRMDSGLIKIIQDDASIEDMMKGTFIEMAKDFDADFERNLFATSLSLNKQFPYGIDSWQQFLMQSKISKYIASFTQEILTKQADSNIKEGTNVREASNLKKQLAGNAKGQDNFGIVIMYIPKEEERVYEPFDTTGEDN